MVIRSRFAPSPTGYMHVGNLRTALYAFLFAKHHRGTFILRIEDTDRKRNVPAAIRVIYNTLAQAKLEHDEGPDKDRGFGPYVQSERMEIYKRFAEEAVERGIAFRCFCAAEKPADPTAKKPTRKQERRDPCRLLTAEAVQRKLDEGIPYVVRQRIPDDGSTSFTDLVFGTITVSNSVLDDQVLLKSDGFPTYNFANVVDDHLMQISHVLRGLEYLSSTPKYNLLYSGFGWEPPQYVHLPLIVGTDGKKLSKRNGDASFQDLLTKGYLPEAIVNYIALLGWNPGTDREVFSLEELIEEFSVERINKSKSMFDIDKLNWINGQHMRALSPEQFHLVATAHYPAEIAARFDIEKISRIIQPRVVHLTEIPGIVAFLAELPDYTLDLFVHEKSKSSLESSSLALKKVLECLERITPGEWNNLKLVEELKALAVEMNVKNGTVMWPMRIAIAGLLVTPGGATELAEILGKEETLRRLKLGIKKLG